MTLIFCDFKELEDIGTKVKIVVLSLGRGEGREKLEMVDYRDISLFYGGMPCSVAIETEISVVLVTSGEQQPRRHGLPPPKYEKRTSGRSDVCQRADSENTAELLLDGYWLWLR